MAKEKGQQLPHRFHIWKFREKWYCYDYVMNCLGIGATVKQAQADCQLELEMATDSDLHK